MQRVLCGALLLVTAPLAAQQERDTTVNREPVRLTPIAVTATRNPRNIFDTPNPILVFGARELRERHANSIADLFVSQPGLDVTGVGVNQVRPVIRGQRGQRILLLQDGLRLGNSRRQQDFGELPALVGVASVERVEVVRGPASVLYGSDAIGGVVNVITRSPSQQGLHGGMGYLYGTAGEQQRATGRLLGRFGAWSFAASGSFRDAGSYVAPGGTYGDITLADTTRVQATGTRDWGTDARLTYDLDGRNQVWAAYGRYEADTSGFGFVDPAAYSPGDPAISILYPDQQFERMSAGWRGTELALPIADRLEVTAYRHMNDRSLLFDIVVPFGPPGAGVAVNQTNRTSIETLGGRLELSALLGGAARLTYGVDAFRDRTDNVDTSVTTVVGFGPPTIDSVTVPSVPNATFRSAGAFAQAEIRAVDALGIVVAARYQDVEAATDALTATDRTVVGSFGLTYGLGLHVSLVGNVGRAFRSPNLVERFFNGPTPEGGAFQTPNVALEAEKSLNVDLGVRYRDARIVAEGFVFRNEIRDGIRPQATGNTVVGLPEYQNVNLDRPRYLGFEGSADVVLPWDLSVGATYTRLGSKDALDPLNPVGDTYSSKFTAHARITPARDLFAEYAVRVNGDRRDVLPVGSNPVGTALPGFTTHGVRAGWTFLNAGGTSHRVVAGVTNLTNVLYAEAANASFFRPEPGRTLTVSYDLGF